MPDSINLKSRGQAAETSRIVALAGNPNCGKTTLFNALTGLRYKVANYPGVTVERKAGRLCLPSRAAATIVDLPGTYSLCGGSADEQIATRFITGTLPENPIPDLVLATVDASNIERGLYLVSQILDTGLPTILVLTMMDVAHSLGMKVYPEILSRALGIPVVPLVANRGEGLRELLSEMERALLRSPPSPTPLRWVGESSPYKAIIAEIGAETSLQLGWPANGAVIFGGGLVADAIPPPNSSLAKFAHEARQSLISAGIDPLTFEATARYRWVHEIVSRSVTVTPLVKGSLTARLDDILTHRVWGFGIFVGIMALVFQAIFLWSQYPMTLIEGGMEAVGAILVQHLPDGILRSLVIDGVVAGVGSVLVFIPQIAVLFLCIGLLEESGYLSRAAFLMDAVMRRVGLQGRSFIPLLSSFACAIPGIMATRSIPSWSDRLATILVAPLMSCSARLPVYAVLIAAFIPERHLWGVLSLQGLTLLMMYLLGILGAAIVSWILKMSLLRREPAFLVMEMPLYRCPSVRNVLRDVLDRIWLFVKSAGTVILSCSILLWFLATFPQREGLPASEVIRQSYAGQLGSAIEPLIRPLGFNWEIGIAILGSFAAREVFVSSLATIYNLSDESDATTSLVSALQAKHHAGYFSTASAISLMVFYVFACQCMSTLAVCRRETGSWKWVGFMFVYMTLLAYIASFCAYRLMIWKGVS